MAVATEKRTYTVDEFWQLCHQTDKRLELIRGELRELTPTGWQHGVVVVNATRLLSNYVVTHRLGIVLGAETGVVLPIGERDEGQTVRAADVAYVQRERLPQGALPARFADIVPDLVVEVTSPSDTYAMVAEKVNDWLRAGVRMVWVADPSNRQVSVHRPGQPVRVFGEEDVLSGEDVLPGFACKVSELFAW
jgi:Uma2 family endonuclease